MTIYLFILAILAFVSGQLFSINLNPIVRITFFDLSVFLLITFCLFKFGKKIINKNYIKIFGPYLVISVISLIFQIYHLSGSQIFISSLYLIRFFFYTVLIFIPMVIPQKISLICLWVGGVTLSILGLIQYFLYPNLRNLSYLGWDPHQYRIFSTLLDPNFTGMILVLTLILGTYLYRINHKGMIHRDVIILSVPVFLALLLTYSRGSYITLLVVFGSYFWIQRKVKIFIIYCFVFIAMLFLLPRPGGEGVNLFRIISVQSRIENNQEAWQLFISSPVIGHGFNTLQFVRDFPLFSDPSVISHSASGFHNSWLTILATTGILGLVGYLWIWLMIIKRINKNSRDNELVIFTLVAVFMHSFFDNSLFYPWVMFWLWIVAGIFISDNKLKSDDSWLHFRINKEHSE